MLLSIQFEAHSRPPSTLRPSLLYKYISTYSIVIYRFKPHFFFKQMNSAWDEIKKNVPNMYGAQALLDQGFM